MSRNGLADQLLADRVAAGGINIIDAASPDRLQQRGGCRLVHALDGDAAEAQAGYLQPGLSQCDMFHHTSSPFQISG